jgi:hypothetical protein
MFSEPPKPTAADRVLFGKVAVPQRDLPEVEHVGGRRPYERKAGLLVRAGVAIAWGDSGVVSTLRIARCFKPPNRWNVYTGGFRLRRLACVPLLVHVGGRERRVWFALSRHC